MKSLPKQLFKTFIFSVLLTIAASSIYYSVWQKGQGIDYSQAFPKMVEGMFFLNMIIFVMSLPSLFLVNMAYWNNLAVRLLLYFSGQVIFIITALCLSLKPADKVVYLITGFMFLIVHAVFYYLTVKKNA